MDQSEIVYSCSTQRTTVETKSLNSKLQLLSEIKKKKLEGKSFSERGEKRYRSTSLKVTVWRESLGKPFI